MVKNIGPEKLASTLQIYAPKCRYLIEAKLDYPIAEGKFRLDLGLEDNLLYTTQPVEHMTYLEAGLCMNQLSFSAFGEWFPEDRFEKNFSYDTYLKLMKENMFLIDISMKFRKSIAKTDDIFGKIEVKQTKKFGDLYLVYCDYDIEEGKSNGTLKFALKF